MTRTAIWTSIAATLEGEIAAELYTAGDKLPTEAALAARFGVNRHTVRRALGDLADRGLLRFARGAGGVLSSRRQQTIPSGRRVRFSQNICAFGTGFPPKKRLADRNPAPAANLKAKGLGIWLPGNPVLGLIRVIQVPENAPFGPF